MERQLSVSFHFLKIYMNASKAPPHCHPRERSDNSSRGDWLSAYLLNFQRFSDRYIKLVDLNSHPPFELPV